MCGIVGIIGREAVAERLFEGLKRLEYRGYDSAGIATIVGSDAQSAYDPSVPQRAPPLALPAERSSRLD